MKKAISTILTLALLCTALAGCGKGGKLIYEKHAQDGMTIAIAKRDWSVGFDEE